MKTKELCILEKYLNAIEQQKRVTKKFAETIISILDVLYEKSDEKNFFIGDIYLTDEGYYLDKDIWYKDENYKDRREVKIVTDTSLIQNGGYMHGEFDFYSNWNEWWVKTVNRNDLLYIAKNLKKWIIEHIETKEKQNKELKEGLINLKNDFANLDSFLKKIKEEN